MKKTTLILMTMIAALFFSGHAFAHHHAVKVAEKDSLGHYLTDTKGMTLYWFVKDSAGKSVCQGGCLKKWPAYYRPEVVAPNGINADDFGTMTRPDGSKQTTFRGYPLYYFFKDQAPGDTKGQGVKKIWYVVDPSNFPAK